MKASPVGEDCGEPRRRRLFMARGYGASGNLVVPRCGDKEWIFWTPVEGIISRNDLHGTSLVESSLSLTYINSTGWEETSAQWLPMAGCRGFRSGLQCMPKFVIMNT